MLSIGSLFSGIGGLDLGLERAGLGPVRWFCESDPFCRRVLAERWEGVTVFDDIVGLNGNAVPPVDLICGGFPCQDVSSAGKGAGLSGARSGLWFEMARVIREARPRFVVVENVPTLAARGLDRVLSDLAKAGYDALWFPLRAADVGAPHRRERLFVVAWRVPNTERDAVRDEPERGLGAARPSDSRDSEPRHVGAADVGDTVQPRLSNGDALAASGRRALTRSGCLDVEDAAGGRRDDGRPGQPRKGEAELAGSPVADADSGRREGERQPQYDSVEGAPGSVADRHGDDGRLGWPPEPSDDDGWREWVARGGPEPVLRRDATGFPLGVDGAPAHPPERRRRARELASIRRSRLRALGNAVVPQVGEAVGWVVRGIAERLKQGES